MSDALISNEAIYWSDSHHLLHFVGICGAGKSTLSSRLAQRCQHFGGKAIGTIDYDPHTPDHIRTDERAFNRELDLLNIEANFKDPKVHQKILDHSLNMIKRWKDFDANAVFIDRWYESYDQLPAAFTHEIESAIKASGFHMCHILLLIGNPAHIDHREAIRERLLHTKVNRPGTWWEMGPSSLDEWVNTESDYQSEYKDFCVNSQFPHISVETTDMDWNTTETQIIHKLLEKQIL